MNQRRRCSPAPLTDQVRQGRSNGTGWWYAHLGDFPQCLCYCRQALASFEEEGDRFGAAQSWDSLGFAYRGLGEHRRAVDCYQHAIDLFQSAGNRGLEAESLVRLAEAEQAAGDHAAAQEAWKRALEILEETDHPQAEAVRKRLT